MGFYVSRPFYLESKATGHRFVSLMSNNVVIDRKTGEKNQQFQFDQASLTIKSLAMSNKSLKISSNGGGTNLEVDSTSRVWYQIFKYQGERLVNCQNGKAIEITRDADGQNVFIQHTPRNTDNQKFTIRYVDSTTVERKYLKGELNKEYGFKVGMAFSIYTRM
jgi:hypothetical protein